VAVDELHLDRERAGSFGSVAEQYDRYRPAPPAALIDDLVALGPSRVLDIGCGTGKASVALAARGLSVLGVEIDARMADVARGHGIAVEVAAFEVWESAGRQFDLIICGDAWHWIDPDLGIAKAATLVSAGGTIARFWSFQVLDEAVIEAFDAVYRRLAPEVTQAWRSVPSLGHVFDRAPSEVPEPFAANDVFASVETKTFRWDRTLSADDWVGQAATFSDHQRLGAERLAALTEAIRVTITDLGGTVESHCGTYFVSARRTPA
jgi:SAM-dependent methyltransferase